MGSTRPRPAAGSAALRVEVSEAARVVVDEVEGDPARQCVATAAHPVTEQRLDALVALAAVDPAGVVPLAQYLRPAMYAVRLDEHLQLRVVGDAARLQPFEQ